MLEQKIFNYLSKLEAEFTAATTDIITSAAHGLIRGDKLQLTTTTTLPAGLSASTDYFVKEVTTNTFEVSAILDGPSVDITDTGTGTHSLHLKGRAILTEGYEHLKLGLNTTGSTNLTIKFQGSDSDDAPDFNAAQSSTNGWDYLDVLDSEDGSSIDGDTGIPLSGSADNRQFTVNQDSVRWVSAVITAWTAGTVNLELKANKKY